MSLDAIQQKKQVIESRSRIREFVFGIQDGLISTVGLLAGDVIAFYLLLVELRVLGLLYSANRERLAWLEGA